MPAIDSGKVLVTGANGYIAVWVVKAFLDHGFSVRGTVRSESKAPYLRNLFKSYGDKFEVVIVDDITKVGLAFSSVSLTTPHLTHLDRTVRSTRPSRASMRSHTPPRPSI